MIINPSDATYQLEMSCHNLKKNSWLGFSEVESKPAVLSEVNRKVKAKSSTVDNARTKAATQRPQKPLQQKGKLSHLILWITHILKKKWAISAKRGSFVHVCVGETEAKWRSIFETGL